MVCSVRRGQPFEKLVETEAEMRALGSSLPLVAGDTVFLFGDLGAGKTTLVRGFVEAHGDVKIVRSPTFNLIQLFDTNPPILHADLYRVKSHQGLGIEDYLESHVCFIEWADRAVGLLQEEAVWRIAIEFAGEARRVKITSPVQSDNP